MLKPAFSTVACPEWTLPMVAERARLLGFEAVELRTFGESSRQFACDPALSSDEKVRRIFREQGVEILSLASSARFDEQVFPPVVGYLITDHERCVREAQRAVELAVLLECPYVRVFGFEFPERETRSSGLKRIAGRLALVVDHADKSGVKVVVENGGSFGTAEQLMELIGRVDHPLLGASYSLAAGQAAGDEPARAIKTLGGALWVARVKDLKDGKPVLLGQGELACEAFVRGLAASGFVGPLVYEWDRAWMPEIGGAEEALKLASKTLFTWAATSAGAAARTPVMARR